MNKTAKVMCLLMLGILASGIQAADFMVNNIYSDHMVLQRRKPVRISGMANSGDKVTVTIGRNSVSAVGGADGSGRRICRFTWRNSASAVAGADGRWEAVLPEMEAGGPYEVSVVCGGKSIVFKDVLVGEVWVCSGQSNMQFRINGRAYSSMANGIAVAAKASHPRLRFYYVPLKSSVRKKLAQVQNNNRAWQVAEPENVSHMSAVGYFFGVKLMNDLDVPVGLICTSWGGTKIQCWMNEEALQRSGCHRELAALRELQGVKPEDEKAFLEDAGKNYLAKKVAPHEKEIKASEAWKDAAFDDSSWQEVDDKFVIEGTEQGGYYFRKTVKIPQEWVGKDLKAVLGNAHANNSIPLTVYCNGVKAGEGRWPEAAMKENTECIIPAAAVGSDTLQLTVRMVHIFHTLPFMSRPEVSQISCPASGSAAASAVPLSGKWRMKRDFILAENERNFAWLPHIRNPFHLPQPSSLFNSMINPLLYYPVRGVIWYQGESNSGQPEQYYVMQQEMVKEWRKLWRNPEMAFIWVQLAAFDKHTPEKRQSSNVFAERPPMQYLGYAPFREMQSHLLKKIPYSGMAVAIDIGDHSNIHPENKWDVGRRLAAEAERVCYGRKTVSAGPVIDKIEFKDGKAVLSFTNTGSGLVSAGADKLNTFAIAGADKKYVWGKAVIEGGKVVVSSPDVTEPKYVSYAFTAFPVNPNLYNREGFPAVPFRSDLPEYLK